MYEQGNNTLGGGETKEQAEADLDILIGYSKTRITGEYLAVQCYDGEEVTEEQMELMKLDRD